MLLKTISLENMNVFDKKIQRVYKEKNNKHFNKKVCELYNY